MSSVRRARRAVFGRRSVELPVARARGPGPESNGNGATPLPAVVERDAPPAPLVHRATWLASDLLLLGASLPDAATGPLDASVELDGTMHAVRAGCLALGAASAPATHLLTVGRPGLRLGRRVLTLRRGGIEWTLAPKDLERVTSDLRTFLRTVLAPLDARTRAHVLEFLSWAPVRHPGSREDPVLHRSLLAVRQALRERLPLVRSGGAAGLRLHVGVAAAVDDRWFYVRGWVRTPGERVARLTAVAPEGGRAELLPAAFRHPRPDVQPAGAPDDPAGFAAAFELRGPSALAGGWVVEAQLADGRAAEAPAPDAVTDPVLVRDRLLSDLGLEQPFPGTAFLPGHVHPALARIQERIRSSVEVAGVEDHGEQPEAPAVSLVVPIGDGAGADLVEIQLAHLAGDADLRAVEVLYAATPGPAADRLAEQAPWLARLYGVAFRLCVLDRSVPPSMAVDAAGEAVRGRRLLIMHPDVVPVRPGWLRALTRFQDRTPGAGVVAPRLLYDDETIEHAGIGFRLPHRSPLWEDAPRLRGFHRSVPAADTPARVPAVSGACFMVERDLFGDVGGLDAAYVAGDLAVSDLCLRLAVVGYGAWYVPGAELYHPHLPAVETPLAAVAARYDAWLRTRRWGERMAEAEAGTDAPAREVSHGHP